MNISLAQLRARKTTEYDYDSEEIGALIDAVEAAHQLYQVPLSGQDKFLAHTKLIEALDRFDFSKPTR